MKKSKSKQKQAFIVNQAEQLFPDLEFLSPLCLKNLLVWKAEQLFDLALRISELSSALKKWGDFPDDEESNLFYSKLNRSTKNKFVDFTLAACVEFEIITMGELETVVLTGHTAINITTLQKSFEFALRVLKIKISEPHSLVTLASACSILSSVYRLNKDSIQENILKTFIAIEHRLTAKSCEAIGYWSQKLERKIIAKEGQKTKKEQRLVKEKSVIDNIKKILNDQKIRVKFMESTRSQEDVAEFILSLVLEDLKKQKTSNRTPVLTSKVKNGIPIYTGLSTKTIIGIINKRDKRITPFTYWDKLKLPKT